jgi:hypothetical protein
MTAFSAEQCGAGTSSHSLDAGAQAPSLTIPFSDDVCKHSPTMTDEEREAAAYRAGCAMNGWYSQYQQTGNPAYLDNAYSCLGMMRTLLAGRSPEYVAKLEAERGLA